MYTLTQPGIQAPPELVGPDYNLYRYRDDCYKVIRFKSTAPRGIVAVRAKEDGFKHEDKLPQALSRARKVCLELALCNDWKWFATFTIAKDNYDRKNLDGYYERFSEWLKYMKKKSGKKIPYLLVPEQHGDGSWHMHGFFNSDIDQFLKPFKDLWEAGEHIPYKLVKNDYYNWAEYQKKFGFCSFGKIRNHDATAFYATKYISKSFQGDAQRVGLKLYYCSQGLNRAEYFDSVYGPCAALDGHLRNHYEFCSTGFVAFERQPGDDPLLDILEMQKDTMCPMEDLYRDEDFPEVVEYYEDMQEVIRAQAASVIYGTELVETVLVVGAALVGLGVLPKAASTAFDLVVSDVVSNLGLSSFLEVATWVSGGFQRYAAPQWLIEDIRDCLFSQSVVTTKTVVDSSGYITAGTQIESSSAGTITINVDSFAFFSKKTLLIFNVAGGYPSVTLGDGTDATIWNRKTSAGWKYYAQIDGVSSETYPFPVTSSYTFTYDAVDAYWDGELTFSPIETITVSSGLVAGMIAGETLSFADGYATWASGAVSLTGADLGVETEEESDVATVYVPVAISQTYSETISQTQTEVQTGESSYDDTTESATTGLLGTIIGWLESIWSAICSIPAAISSVYNGVISLVDFFTGTSVVESPLVAINFEALFELFPFNIPYGIYQAITFWSAGAVAPTITIPLPTISGRSVDIYEYTINFSDIPGMDALASIIRAGELILFVVGLAMITRKVTKW